jgi:hypothetical protein
MVIREIDQDGFNRSEDRLACMNIGNLSLH